MKSVFDPPHRLALAINADGEKWITTVRDTGRTPRTVVHKGKAFTVLMTASVEHIDFANHWLAGR